MYEIILLSEPLILTYYVLRVFADFKLPGSVKWTQLTYYWCSKDHCCLSMPTMTLCSRIAHDTLISNSWHGNKMRKTSLNI